jgi:predicted flavoprotein YhiN
MIDSHAKMLHMQLKEVELARMESKKIPRLFIAGELLDVDGVTGGYNFQSAWTSGWIAGRHSGLSFSTIVES